MQTLLIRAFSNVELRAKNGRPKDDQQAARRGLRALNCLKTGPTSTSVQSMPFARPHFREILAALDFVVAKDYPARGEA